MPVLDGWRVFPTWERLTVTVNRFRKFQGNRVHRTCDEECWTLSPNPTNTHSGKQKIAKISREGVVDITGMVTNSYFLKKSPYRKLLIRS